MHLDNTLVPTAVVAISTLCAGKQILHVSTGNIGFFLIYNNYPSKAQSLYLHRYITLKQWKFLRGSMPLVIIVRKNVHQKIL